MWVTSGTRLLCRPFQNIFSPLSACKERKNQSATGTDAAILPLCACRGSQGVQGAGGAAWSLPTSRTGLLKPGASATDFKICHTGRNVCHLPVQPSVQGKPQVVTPRPGPGEGGRGG